ncbi:MAG TPA: DUF6691 family protein [Candidatus Sulfotelmatobacter sp.]|jgi:uncharacterized membrane protein YedE/YeeE|nr:DUF6691 family protein [Candidatus Sulfotelmatobacter sp.]
MKTVIALASGLLFGIGLAMSGMADPAVVQGFLDIGGLWRGDWNPALAAVMAGAVPTALLCFRLAGSKVPPPSREITKSLIIGSTLFGLGWGLVGMCPGPALQSWLADPFAWVFILPMLAGLALAPAAASRLFK